MQRKNRLSKITNNKNDKIFTSPLFTVRISKSEGEVKFGFVVSKRVSKSAVLRNRTKRVVKSAARSLIEKISDGVNIIVISKKELSFEDLNNVSTTLFGILTKAGLIK